MSLFYSCWLPGGFTGEYDGDVTFNGDLTVTGTTTTISTTDLLIKDKVITLNDGGGAASGGGAGIEVEESSSISAYWKVNGARTGWDMLVPASAQVFSIIPSASGSYTLTVSGNTYVNQDMRSTASPSWSTITSTVATGTAPFSSTSTTLCTNVNADRLDGYDYIDLQRQIAMNPVYIFNDFDRLTSTNNTYIFPFTTGAISTGTVGAANGTYPYPGQLAISSSGTNNSGYRIVTGATTYLGGPLVGGEYFDAVFTPNIVNGVTIRIGMHNWLTSATGASNGAYIQMDNSVTAGKVKGVTEKATATTSTSYSTNPLVAGTWYRARVAVNSNATLVTFSIYTCSTGVLFWSDTLALTIPTGVGETFGYGIVATENPATTSLITTVDIMGFNILNGITR